MKKSTKIIGGALVAAAAANAVHAAMYKPKKTDLTPLPEEKFNVQRYRENLSKAIQFKTISNRATEKVDWNEFDKFHKFLEEAYPLVHSKLEKEVVPPANLLYRWKGSRPELKPIALLAHQDVVPVTSGTEKDWVHGAFEGVDDGDVKISGESLLHICREIVELQCLCVGLLGIPHSCVETCRATVQMVGAVVDGEVVLFAVNSELAFADAVAITADKCAEEWLGAVQKIVDAVVSLDYIGVVAVLVGDHNAAYCATVVCDCNFVALLVLQYEQRCLFAANGLFEISGFQL